MKKAILLIVAVLVAGYIIFDKIGDVGLTKEFTQKQNSLVAAVDSMRLDIEKEDAVIDSLNYVYAVLTVKSNILKDNIKALKEDKSELETAAKMKPYEIDSFFVVRYAEQYKVETKDTTILPVPVSKAVVVDLLDFDRTKNIVLKQDSLITNLETKVSNKDSVNAVFIKKENTYRNMLSNQDTQIKDWKYQFNALQLQNAKLKAKNKFTKIGAGLIVGGLVYLMVAK